MTHEGHDIVHLTKSYQQLIPSLWTSNREALDPMDDDTRGSRIVAVRRCALPGTVESGTAASQCSTCLSEKTVIFFVEDIDTEGLWKRERTA